jgi:uncharacterized membrane protein YjjP (DUF1212 family)
MTGDRRERCSRADAEGFVVELARALLRIGTPAHRLEDSLASVCACFGLEAESSAVPTNVTICFTGDAAPRTYLVRSDPGDTNLEKLSLIEDVREQVLDGRLRPGEGVAALRSILAAPQRYGIALLALSYAVIGAGIAAVFRGGLKEIAAAGLIGLLTGILDVLGRRSKPFGRVSDLVAAALAAFLVAALAHCAGPLSAYQVTVTGLIVLVPGLSLTVAMTELSTLHWVSGTARLMGAGVTFLKLAFGIAIGGRIGAALFGAPVVAEPPGLPSWVEAVSLIVTALAFTVVFQARPRDAGWILAASVLSVAGSRLGTHLLGPEIGPGLGAFLITAGANLQSRILRRPARILIVPSLVFLVPGSVGFRSVSLLLEADAVTGVNTAFRMSLAALSLAAGILFANLVLPQRRIGRK